MRENAWKVDGWAETVSKVCFQARIRTLKRSLTLSTDRRTSQVDGFVHSDPSALQPTEVIAVPRELVRIRHSQGRKTRKEDSKDGEARLKERLGRIYRATIVPTVTIAFPFVIT